MNSPAETAAPLRLWATAVILQSPEPGKLLHVVGYRCATSSAEAIGKAIKAAQEMHPTATLNGVAEIEIDPDHIRRVAATLPAPASH